MNNIHTLGDRTLSVWVHWSNLLHFTTYDFDYNSNVNVVKNVNFDYDNDFANKWFFIYYGYSRKAGKAFYYLKFRNNEYSGEIKARHFIPNFAQFRLGKDEWHYAWNGDMKFVQVQTGEGAFRTTNFQELIALKPRAYDDEEQFAGKPRFNIGEDKSIQISVETDFNKPVVEHVFDMD